MPAAPACLWRRLPVEAEPRTATIDSRSWCCGRRDADVPRPRGPTPLLLNQPLFAALCLLLLLLPAAVAFFFPHAVLYHSPLILVPFPALLSMTGLGGAAPHTHTSLMQSLKDSVDTNRSAS